MKKLILLIAVGILLSCNDEKPAAFDSKIFTEKQVIDFIGLYPNWTKNVNTEAEITEKFKHKMINLSNEEAFLTDFPLQLKAVLDTMVSEQSVKLAVFKSFKDEARAEESILNNLELEIRGIMSVDQVKNLSIDKKYTLKGMLYKQGKRADVKFFHANETPIYTLGKYTFWNIEAEAIK